MAISQAQFPWPVRAAPDPPGWYLRPSIVDHRAIADAVTRGSVGLHGVVFVETTAPCPARLNESSRASRVNMGSRKCQA